ncbi:MAG: hypothetical protein KF863_01655 [Rubrivivax sp.]|nr:hypothetical protein [Rubrivivax sp.]
MSAYDPPPGPATLPLPLLAQTGEAVAAAASRLQAAWPGAPAAATAEIGALEELGLQLQATARVLAAPAGARPERVDLGVAALQARAEWTRAFARAGASWRGPEQGVEVVTNAPVLKLLLDLALAHALGLGSQVRVDVLLRGQPVLATLCVEVSRPGGALFQVRPGEAAELHWQLLTLLARHAGVVAERQVQAQAVELSLAWPPAASASSGALALQPLPEPAMLPATPLPAGLRVLLLEPHEPTRVLAERLMAGAGLRVQAAATVGQARGALLQALPDVLVSGLPGSDPALALLLQDLRARQGGLRVLELSNDPHAFATSLPQAGAPARVARDDLERTLVAALAQELNAPG